MRLKSTLEQWLTLHEIDRCGSIQGASSALNKSHTTLIYAIRRLETQVGVTLLKIDGKRSVLTEQGRALLRRATPMLEQAYELELISGQVAKGYEAQLVVSVDHLCCRDWVYQPLNRFFEANKLTSVKLVETSLSGTTQAVMSEQSDIAVINLPVTNVPTESFGTVSMVTVTSASHPLAARSNLTLADLMTETQVVIRDLGSEAQQQGQDVGWLKSGQRVTVDSFDHAWDAIKSGIGFGRVPEHKLEQMQDGSVIKLTVEHADRYHVPLHISLPKGAKTGPAALALYQHLCEDASRRMSEGAQQR